MRYAKVAILACLLACAATAAGQGNCSAPMLQGTYVFEHSGFIYMGVAMPYTNLGTISAASNGDLVLNYVHVYPFGAANISELGRWSVTPDCKLTAEHFGSPPDMFAGAAEGFVLHQGEEVRLVMTDPLTVDYGFGPLPLTGSSTLRRMNPGGKEIANCSNSTVRGTYAQTCTSWTMLQDNSFLPHSALFTVTALGDGTATGGGKLIVGGQIIPFEYKNVSYTIEPNCRGTASFENTAMPGTTYEALVVFDNGKQMISTTTAPVGEIDICHFTRIQP